MATLIWVEGWEHGALSTAGTGIVNGITGTGMSISSAIKRTGAYSFRALAESSAGNYVTKNIAGSPTCLVYRFYVYFTTKPAATTTIFQAYPASTAGFNIIYNQPADKFYADIGATSGTASSVTPNTGQWYCIDVKADCSANPYTLDWQIDGVAQTQDTSAIAASTFASIRVGTQTATTYDIFFDDIIVSATSGDYPLGAGSVVGLSPTGDGTHNAGTNTIEDQSGNDIGAVTAYNLLDDVPMTSESDYVRQVATGDYYAEVTFADTAETSIVGAMAYLAYHAGSAAANDGATKIIDEDATSTDIFDGDMSEATISYKSVILPNPTGGWDQAAVNALKARVGYSSDVTPNPYWDALMIQVAIGAGATAYSLVCSGGSYAVTGTAASPLRGAKVAIGAGEYAVTGTAAGAYYGRAIDADAGVYALTGGDVTMPRTYRLTPDAGVYALTGTALAALYGRLLGAGAGTYAVTGADIAALYGRRVTAGAGAYDLTGSAVATLYGRAIDADTGEYIVTGQAVTLTYTPGGGAYIITAEGGVYAVTGTAAGLLLARLVSAGAGEYSVTGSAASPLLGRVVSAGAGEYLVTGTAAATLLGRLISAASGSYIVTGTDVTLTYTPSGAAYILTAEGGTYAVTGVDAALLRAARIAPEPGVYNLAGMDAATLIGRLVDAGAGVYAVTGGDAALLMARKVAAGVGVYDINGQAATLTYSGSGQYTLACEAGSYVITGTAATLLKHILHPDTIYPKPPTRSIQVDGPKRTAVVGEKYKATISRRRTWS